MINEVESMMKSIIQSSAHDDSRKDENPDGKGEFGHTKTNPVPVLIVSDRDVQVQDGILADVAPTILSLMGIAQPDEMSGRSLIVS